MNAQNLLGLLLLAIVVLVTCALPNHHHARNGSLARRRTQTHQVERVRVPEEIRQQFIDHHAKTNKRFANSMKALQHFKTSSRADASTTLPLENWYDWILIANITVGTPPQSLRAFLSTYYDEDLYVLGAGAIPANDSATAGPSSSSSYSIESSSEESNPTTTNSSLSRVQFNAAKNAKNTYDASASSTSVSSGQNFTGLWPGSDIGVVVSDVVNLAGLDLKLQIGALSVYDWFLQVIPADGVIGLSSSPSANNIPNLLEQLADQISQPTVVLNTHRDFEARIEGIDDPTERNELVLGTTSNIAGCDSDFEFLPAGSASPGQIDSFNVVSASIAGSDTSLALAPSNGSRPVYVTNYFLSSVISYELQALFVEASGAQRNSTSDWYSLPIANISQAKTVQLAVKGGGTINLQPTDYLLQFNGTFFLPNFAYYNETDPNYSGFEIALGQQYLNNHCLAYNIKDKSIGVTYNVVVSPSTVAGDSASIAKASGNKVMVADAEAKLPFGFEAEGRRV